MNQVQLFDLFFGQRIDISLLFIDQVLKNFHRGLRALNLNRSIFEDVSKVWSKNCVFKIINLVDQVFALQIDESLHCFKLDLVSQIAVECENFLSLFCFVIENIVFLQCCEKVFNLSLIIDRNQLDIDVLKHQFKEGFVLFVHLRRGLFDAFLHLYKWCFLLRSVPRFGVDFFLIYLKPILQFLIVINHVIDLLVSLEIVAFL